MVPSNSKVPLPHLGVPALTPPSLAALSMQPRSALRFLPPITSAPSSLQSAVGPAQNPPCTRLKAQGDDKDPDRALTMAGQEETLPWGCEKMSPGVTLTNSLITMKNLGETPHPENRPTELLYPSSLRLDRENICAVGRLQSLWWIHSLYLQQNQIKKIENLGCFPNLRFLSLAGNHIHRVENLQSLQHLHVLDLSHNRIQRLDTDELPRSLRLLDLTGNECTQQQGYRELVVGALPHLLQLDGQPIHGSEEEEEEGSSSSDNEDDEWLSEPSDAFTAGKDFFVDMHQELAGRSRQRQRKALEEHQTRLEELQELQERQGQLEELQEQQGLLEELQEQQGRLEELQEQQGRLEELQEQQGLLEELQEWQGRLLPPAPLSPGREGAAGTTSPGPWGSQSCPQAKPGTQLPPLLGPGRKPTCLQPRPKALEEETRAEGARNRPLPKIPRASTAPRGWD